MEGTRDAEHSARQMQYYLLTLANGSRLVGKLADPPNDKVFHVGVISSLSLCHASLPLRCSRSPVTLLFIVHSIATDAIGHLPLPRAAR
ncbi:hypothetical protein DL93DRAFT_2087130 [Clavulina sp. PMI_390]|nr:hypothetical protein DL93DRAFT_2087130 [Clavulina sp. PMI_390]